MATTQVSMAGVAPGVRGASAAAFLLGNGRTLAVVAQSAMPAAFVVVGLAVVVVLLWGLAGQMMLPTVTVGTNDRVAYAGLATREEAQKLGAALQAAGYFRNSGKTVRLIRDGRGTLLSVFVGQGQWKDKSVVEELERVAGEIAVIEPIRPGAVGGALPIRVHLLDMSGKLERELVVGRGNR